MSRTHHATRTWRLSCGCLRDYPGMPLVKTHFVLCASCGTSVTTLYAYDDDRCGFTTTTSRPGERDLSHVSCTNPPGSESCAAGDHYDKYVQLRFRAQGRLRADRRGHTHRA